MLVTALGGWAGADVVRRGGRRGVNGVVVATQSRRVTIVAGGRPSRPRKIVASPICQRSSPECEGHRIELTTGENGERPSAGQMAANPVAAIDTVQKAETVAPLRRDSLHSSR